MDCEGETPTGVASLAESKENHSGLTQEIMALELSQNTPKRMSIHPTPDKRKNPIKGVLKKRYVPIYNIQSMFRLLMRPILFHQFQTSSQNCY